MTAKGITTTEFWVHNLLQVGVIVQGFMGTIKPEIAAYMSAGLGVVYIVARAITKFGGDNPTIIPIEGQATLITGATGNSPTGGIPFRGSDGKNLLLIFAAMLMAASLSGCSLFVGPTPATPQDQAVQQVVAIEEGYLALTTPVDIAIATGSIKGKTAADIKAAEDVAIAYIDAALTAAKSGTPADVNTQLQLFQTARQELIRVIAAANAPTGAGIPPRHEPATPERMDALHRQIKQQR